MSSMYSGNKDVHVLIHLAVKRDKISDGDAALIHEYGLELSSARGLGILSISSHVNKLIEFRQVMATEYSAMRINDLYQGIADLKEATSSRGKPYKENTVRAIIVSVRTFTLWMIHNGYSSLPESKVQAIKAPPITRQVHKPEDLLTPDEITSLIAVCKSPRDQALISLLYEAGVRIKELAHLRWDDLTFDPPYGIKLYVKDEKEHTTRYVRVLMAAPYLATWRNVTSRSGPDDYVFISRNENRPMKYTTLYEQIKLLARRAGIEKNVHPHIFRHSRVTHLITGNVQESIIKKMMWNNLNTRMFQTYVSLSEDDIDNAISEKAGIRMKGKPSVSLEPIQCQICGGLNGPTHQFCSNCGKPLTAEARASVENVSAYARTLPEYEALSRMIEDMIAKQMGQIKIQ